MCIRHNLTKTFIHLAFLPQVQQCFRGQPENMLKGFYSTNVKEQKQPDKQTNRNSCVCSTSTLKKFIYKSHLRDLVEIISVLDFLLVFQCGSKEILWRKKTIYTHGNDTRPFSSAIKEYLRLVIYKQRSRINFIVLDIEEWGTLGSVRTSKRWHQQSWSTQRRGEWLFSCIFPIEFI